MAVWSVDGDDGEALQAGLWVDRRAIVWTLRALSPYMVKSSELGMRVDNLRSLCAANELFLHRSVCTS